MSISSSIYISCPPSLVREKFLAFSTLPQYHSTFFNSITPQGPLTPGQKLSVVFASMGTMSPTILANTPERFAWEGSIPGIFSGAHSFEFTASGNGTEFTQTEVFGGALGWLMGESWVAGKTGMRAKTIRGWEGFNEDFKKWCEKA